MLPINLKSLLTVFIILLLSPVGYDICRPAYASEQIVLLTVPGCNA